VTDRRVELAVVLGLVGLAAVGLVGIVLLSVLEHPSPDVLGYVVTGAVGAIAGILAKTSGAGPTPVQVQQPPDAPPVPVTEVAAPDAVDRIRASRRKPAGG
jgi:hypothetical protein